MSTGAQNGIIGDQAFESLEVPETQPDNQFLAEDKKMAKFTRTAEYKRQKRWAEDKIRFYQQYLPDGRDISSVPIAEIGTKWVQANEIIKTLNEFLNSYEGAVVSVKEAEGK